MLPSFTFDAALIDDNLPFAGKTVFFRGVTRSPKGYGNWKLEVHLKVNGVDLLLHTITRNAAIINGWYDENEQPTQEAMAAATEMVLAANFAKLALL